MNSLHRRYYPWVVVALFWCIFFLNQADRQVLFSVLPLLKGEMHLSDTQLGLMGSVFFWVYAILVPVAGSLGDVTSRKRLIVTALLVWSISTATSGIAVGFAAILVCRAITAIGEAFYYSSATSILSDYHGESTRATAMAIHLTSAYAGIIVSGALAGYIGQHYGWRVAFLAFGALGILVGVIAQYVLREPKRGQSERELTPGISVAWKDRAMATLRTPSAVLLTLAYLGMTLVNTAYLTWTPTLLTRKFGFELAEAGFHATFWHLVGAGIGVVLGGKIGDVTAVRSVLSRPLLQCFALFAGAPFIFLLGWSDSRAVVIAALGLSGLFRGLYESNLFASLYEVIRPHSRSTSTGMMIGIAYLGGGFAPVVIGWLSDRIALGAALSSMSICYLVAGFLIALDCRLFFKQDSRRMRTSISGISGQSTAVLAKT